tara:strand:- start:11410 stop:11766 length:357 start_codon:yes stop_codon:yes gene_type:complete
MINDYIFYILISFGTLVLLILFILLFSLYSYLKNNKNTKKNKKLEPKINSDFSNDIINDVKIEKNQQWNLKNSDFLFTIIYFNNNDQIIKLKNNNNDTFSISYLLFEKNYLPLKVQEE